VAEIATPDAAQLATNPLPHALFWAVEKDGKTTFFLGTMHIGIDADSRLPRDVWDRFHAATTFVMEADFDDAALGELLKPTQGSLHQALGDVYWKKLEDAVGVGTARAFDHMPAMVPASALSMRGLPPTEPMDKVLALRAGAEHKRIMFLEPAARQIAILTKWLDVKALKMMLDMIDTSAQHASDMIAAYIAGDEHRFLALNDSERDDALHHGYTTDEYDHEMSEMLYDRNASWIDTLERVHAAGGGFVAVGALHLLGPHSVLEILSQRGYKITRITP
jgi:uncharacterized protein YbaP (TraB family)